MIRATKPATRRRRSGSTLSRPKPLWQCPKCGERFITRNMWHSCGRFNLESHFVKCEPHVFDLYKKFERMVTSCGPVRVIPQKTRIVFQVRVRFAGCVTRKSYLRCTLALPERYEHPRFEKIESYAPHFHGHQFRIQSPKDLDSELMRWIRLSYKVGEQYYLAPAETRSKVSKTKR